MVAALRAAWLRPLSRALVARLFARLSFLPFLAGADIPGFSRRLLREIERKRRRGEVSDPYLRGWVTALLAQALGGPGRRKASRLRAGSEPPAFAIVSPGAACNLRCSHCYAATGHIPPQTLSFEEADRLAAGFDAAGTGLFLLSGGEPLLWRSQGLTLIDLAARHPDLLFIVYSNGTLLTQPTAARFAALGNILPLLSLEGLREETAAVRGPGTYSGVLKAMGHLREAGVLFGVSVTATPANAATLASEEFYATLVDREGASFVWVLDLAPLGRAEAAAVLGPGERDHLQLALNRQVDRGRLVVSFLHTRLAPTGCFGADRFDGFVYVDWEGAVRRCVYQPEIRLEGRAPMGSPAEVASMIAGSGALPACPLIRESVMERR
jgi:MoaA/NifB/PqqE/SkfB family radical SAM enzyme